MHIKLYTELVFTRESCNFTSFYTKTHVNIKSIACEDSNVGHIILHNFLLRKATELPHLWRLSIGI